MSNNSKSIIFSAVLCIVCSLLLTAAATGLKPYQQKNVALDMQKNILKSVGLIQENVLYSPEQIGQLYKDSIKKLWTDQNGGIIDESARSASSLPVYVYSKNNTIESYIIPIETRGLWGMIYGYMAVDTDGSTIKGFTVYKHSETPGLGGEIEKLWFQKNFEGKKIVDQGGNFVSISVAKGAVKDMSSKEKQTHYVDGISGATLTGKFLSAGLKDILTQYEPVAVKFRMKSHQ